MDRRGAVLDVAGPIAFHHPAILASFAPTAVAIEGDAATIAYDVLFGTAAAYEDLTETIERSGESWVVSNEKFCGFLTQARVSCP